jgi:sugar/nucleoside kinase (ribokinase family)
MSAAHDAVAIGNAIVDVIAPAEPEFLAREGLVPGSMTLIDEARAATLYDAMAPGVEASGGSAANTVAGVASFGGSAAYVGKVAADPLGAVFSHDIRAGGVAFDTPYLENGAATGRSLINVTPDGQRTMSTFLGAANLLTPDDVDPAVIEASAVTYLEGYLFDPPRARAAFEKAAAIARAAGRRVSITLSDVFVVERWRAPLLAFAEQSVDVLFANENELLALFETADLQGAVEQIRDRVEIAVVTRSEKGSVITCGARTFEVPAHPVERVVDTTGAGDQYAAGFLFGLTRERPLDVCGRLGALAAAEVISHYGPRPQVSLADLAARSGL